MIKTLNSETEIMDSKSEIICRKGEGSLRKRGLKDVKRRNRQVILDAVLEQGGLSRVEIAQKTELAPSTVSALVTELLGEGILMEAGSITTAGRSRTELTVNPAFGTMAVIEISRRETCVTWFDMLLHSLRTEVISRRYVAGNELLSLITDHIRDAQKELPPLVGLGLLFQEDMRESDFRVMYSTGFSAASITLKEALITQYRIPIEEEYSITYTVTNALAEEVDLDARNSAHISVGSRVLASVTLDGADIPLRNDFCEELAGALQKREESRGGSISLVEYLSNLIAMLCMMFPLELIFLSGRALPVEEAEQELQCSTAGKLSQSRMPKLKFLRPVSQKNESVVMAAQVRKRVLVA